MKILVPCKRVSDPDNANKVKVSPDGARVVADGLEHKPNPFDDWAVEAALRMIENAKTNERLGEITVTSLGPKEATQTIRQFLAMGADRGVLVEADDDHLDSFVVARALKAVVEKEGSDLVMMGKQSADGESNATGQILAELLGWPMATSATSVATTDGGKTLEITRETDAGALTVRIQSPAVITVTDRILSPGSVRNGVTPEDHKYPESDSGRYASLKGIMAAKKKPIEEISLATLGVDATTTAEYSHFALPPARSGQTTFVENAADLVQRLHNEAKVL